MLSYVKSLTIYDVAFMLMGVSFIGVVLTGVLGYTYYFIDILFATQCSSGWDALIQGNSCIGQ